MINRNGSRPLRRFEENIQGRDLAVGGIHGNFSRLWETLACVNFDPQVDRLFSIGDLIDHGPASEQVCSWVSKPWFHAVRGKQEQMALDAHRFTSPGFKERHVSRGGAWLYRLCVNDQGRVIDALNSLPLAIEVATSSGMIGIVHAECPYGDWQKFRLGLEHGGDVEIDQVGTMCLWPCRKESEHGRSPVSNVKAVVVGNIAMHQPVTVGNVYHIETAMGKDRGFSLLNLQTLTAYPPANCR